MQKETITKIIVIFLVYCIATGISYIGFSQFGGKKTTLTTKLPIKTSGGVPVFDKTLPKTESCPLNGAMYSEQQKAWWEKHRPLGVMIENHEDARPQSGLSSADVIYEAVAEGGITRFLAVFYCQDGGIVGPVRSARTYFIDFASEYGTSPLYAHVGGANTSGPADAISQLTDYGWTGFNDLNQFSIGFPTFLRDETRLRTKSGGPVDTEHTMYSTTTKLWNFAVKDRKLTNVDEESTPWDETFVPYTFKDEDALANRPTAQAIHLEFWEGYKQYAVDWVYDKAGNVYKRSNGGQPHLDNNTKKQVTAKNLVVLTMLESNANDGYENNAHLLYKTKGTGKAQIFMDGKEMKGTWRKDGRTGRTLLFDSKGTAIKLNKGTIWFSILPTDGIITVK